MTGLKRVEDEHINSIPLTREYRMISQTTDSVSIDCHRGVDVTYLIYRKKLFGHFFISSHGMTGATAPTTKKYKSAKGGSADP